MEKQKELAELFWAMDNTKKSYQKLIAATDELVKSKLLISKLKEFTLMGYRGQGKM